MKSSMLWYRAALVAAVTTTACGSSSKGAGEDSGVGTDGAGAHDATSHVDGGRPDSGKPAHADAGADTSSHHDGGAREAGTKDAAPNETGPGDTGTSTGATGDVSASPDGAATSDGGADGATDSGTIVSTLRVAANELVDNGRTVRLLGVQHSGSEYNGIHGTTVFDGPVDQASVTAILGWRANAVRVPLNEDCWLAINGSPALYSGTPYQSAIAAYVTLLRQNGLYVILDLSWNAGGTNEATGQQEGPDSDHSPAFWTSVADTFKSDQGIVFDLYDEPHDLAWACWLNGGCQSNTGWPVAGMQELITAVRGTGAENVVLAAGLSYANDLSEWLANKPTDPSGNLAASFQTYNFTTCSTSTCWTANVASVAAVAPVVTTELGENDCADGFIDGYMTWADTSGVSYLGFGWNADFSCSSGPALITDWTGTPTAFGLGLKTHLAIENP